MVSVMRLAAMGAMTLQRMLYLRPSLASVSVKPTWASLAAGCKCQRKGPSQERKFKARTYQSNWSGRSYRTSLPPMRC